jgi:hypothetical protein
MPTLPKVDAVVTDPPWDQATMIQGSDDPRGLFAAVAPSINKARRAVIQLGCYTDPAFLAPIKMPFLRTCWLEYAVCSYRGRVLNTADVAYAYGEPLPSRQGARVIPGQCISTSRERDEETRGHGKNRTAKTVVETNARLAHPMPRHSKHVRWLVHWFSGPDEIVVDPFMGSGTTGVVCMSLSRKFVGIEIEPKYFDLCCKRIEAAQAQQRMFR